LSTNTGGEHCCNRILVVEKLPSGWTSFDLGLWDGDPLADVPKDIDGDKIPDLVLSDDRFLNAFDSYEQSISPPVIINIVGNAGHDVTRGPRHRAFFIARMAKAKELCAAHSNGGCAGYVGIAARAGKFDEAWKFAAANYDKDARWTYPTRCRGRITDGGCAGQMLKPRDFLEGLRWFLEDNRYIAKAQPAKTP